MLHNISGIKKCQAEREREGGGHHDLPSKICFPTVPSNFVGETCVSENFWYRKTLRIRERGGASRLSVEILSSHSTENLRRGNLCFRKFLVSKNVKDKRKRERGASRLSLENLFSHRTEQLRRGNLCFRKFLVSKNVKDKREMGGITTFCRNFVVSQYRKSSSGKLVFQKVSGIEKC